MNKKNWLIIGLVVLVALLFYNLQVGFNPITSERENLNSIPSEKECLNILDEGFKCSTLPSSSDCTNYEEPDYNTLVSCANNHLKKMVDYANSLEPEPVNFIGGPDPNIPCWTHLLALLGCWLLGYGGEACMPVYDLNGDGVIDVRDLLLLLKHCVGWNRN